MAKAVFDTVTGFGTVGIIFTCHVSYTWCAKVIRDVDGRLLRSVELQKKIVAPVLHAPLGNEAIIAKSCKSHGANLCLLGKIPQMHRSLNHIPSSKSTTRLKEIRNQTRACWLPILR